MTEIGDVASRERRYFIAHSSVQKDLVLGVGAALEGHAWIDLHEIDVGQIILEEIASGIEAASDFVLIWSRESSESPWVRYECHMAFIRYLEDTAINIRVVCVDDTPVPLHLRPLLQVRELREAEEIAAALSGDPPAPRTLRRFVNRTPEIGVIESVLYSGTKGQVWFVGFAGVGKRALTREGVRRLIADPSKSARVSIGRGFGFVELHLAVCGALGVDLPAEPLVEREAREEARRLVSAFVANGGIWIFEDVQHLLDESAAPGPELAEVIAALEAGGANSPERAAIFTSTRRPSLDGSAADTAEIRRVRGLEVDYSIALLRAYQTDADEEQLRVAARQLDGHPLALEMAAGIVHEEQVDWEAERIATAQAVMGELRLTENAQALMEALAAVNGPLPGDHLAEHLKLTAEVYQAAIAEATSYSLLQESSGFVRAHPLVRDFFIRVFRRRSDYRERIDDLATRAHEFLGSTQRRSVTHVEALIVAFRLLTWANRLPEALELHRTLFGTLLESGIELYNERRYDDALRYFEVVIESTEHNEKAQLYAARCLAHLDRGEEARAIADGLLERTPGDANLLRARGRIEFILRRWDAALDFFTRARVSRPRSAAVLRDVAQTSMRLERWDEAREALERALETNREPGSWIHYYYSQVLEHFGELAEALGAVEAAIRLDPGVAMFHHRKGRIALARGDRNGARLEYRRALELDPSSHEAGGSLTSLQIDEGDLVGAAASLTDTERMPGARRALVRTLRAKLALATGDYSEARRQIQRAVRDESEPESLTLAAQIEFEANSAGEIDRTQLGTAIRPLIDGLRRLDSNRDADAIQAQLDAVS